MKKLDLSNCSRIKVRMSPEEAVFVYTDTLKCVAFCNGSKVVEKFEDFSEIEKFVDWALKEKFKVYID